MNVRKRAVSVSTISLVTVGILIGVDSLGYLFTNGSQRRIVAEIFTGVVMVMIIALVVDTVLVRMGRWLMPWSVVAKKRTRRAQPALSVAGEQ
jgi:osmoprotectant transport system permease protein